MYTYLFYFIIPTNFLPFCMLSLRVQEMSQDPVMSPVYDPKKKTDYCMNVLLIRNECVSVLHCFLSGIYYSLTSITS